MSFQQLVKLGISFPVVLAEYRVPENHSLLCILSVALDLQSNLNCPMSVFPFNLKTGFSIHTGLSPNIATA